MQLRIHPHQHKADREPLSASILPTISHQKYCGDSPMPAKRYFKSYQYIILCKDKVYNLNMQINIVS